MQGRRLPDGDLAERFEPGDYQLAHGRRALWVCLPDGTFGRLDERWTITELWDETVTVTPSIHHDVPGGWHGYLTAGVWASV